MNGPKQPSYKLDVGGSIPSSPTRNTATREIPGWLFLFVRQAWRVARERHLLDCGGQAVTWRCKSSSDPDGGNR